METKFRTILADPPWSSAQGGGKIKRGADGKYPLLKTKDILEVIKNCGYWQIAENSHLYLWTTNSALKDALWLMEQLDFEYKTNLVWLKERMGIGQYFRGKHELLLFGVRGKGLDESVCSESRDIPSGYILPHEKENGKIVHSRKPYSFYDLIEKRSKGPYLEIFARQKRDFWTSYGNQLS